MKSLLFISLMLSLITIPVYGQPCKHLLNIAAKSICKNDTVSTLNSLKKYLKHCKKSDLVASIYVLQGQLYREKGNYGKAIQVFKIALGKYKGPENVQYISDECLWINDAFWGSYIVTDYTILRSLATTYIQEYKYDSSMLYLNKINRKNIPHYYGDVDGMIQIETSIAIQYSACYLGQGDTTSAINILVPYSTFNTGPESILLLRKLKPLLQRKYSTKEIADEIENSIILAKEVKVVNKNGFEGNSIEYFLFGQKISFLNFSMSEFKRFIGNNENLSYLRS